MSESSWPLNVLTILFLNFKSKGISNTITTYYSRKGLQETYNNHYIFFNK